MYKVVLVCWYVYGNLFCQSKTESTPVINELIGVRISGPWCKGIVAMDLKKHFLSLFFWSRKKKETLNWKHTLKKSEPHLTKKQRWSSGLKGWAKRVFGCGSGRDGTGWSHTLDCLVGSQGWDGTIPRKIISLERFPYSSLWIGRIVSSSAGQGPSRSLLILILILWSASFTPLAGEQQTPFTPLAGEQQTGDLVLTSGEFPFLFTLLFPSDLLFLLHPRAWRSRPV